MLGLVAPPPHHGVAGRQCCVLLAVVVDRVYDGDRLHTFVQFVCDYTSHLCLRDWRSFQVEKLLLNGTAGRHRLSSLGVSVAADCAGDGCRNSHPWPRVITSIYAESAVDNKTVTANSIPVKKRRNVLVHGEII